MFHKYISLQIHLNCWLVANLHNKKTILYVQYFRTFCNMIFSKLYSDCFKSSSLATAGIRCAALQGLHLIEGREIPTDGNCMLSFSSDQIEMRFCFCIFDMDT